MTPQGKGNSSSCAKVNNYIIKTIRYTFKLNIAVLGCDRRVTVFNVKPTTERSCVADGRLQLHKIIWGFHTSPGNKSPHVRGSKPVFKAAACSMEHSSFHDRMHEALGFTGLLDSSSICQCVHEMEKII